MFGCLHQVFVVSTDGPRNTMMQPDMCEFDLPKRFFLSVGQILLSFYSDERQLNVIEEVSEKTWNAKHFHCIYPSMHNQFRIHKIHSEFLSNFILTSSSFQTKNPNKPEIHYKIIQNYSKTLKTISSIISQTRKIISEFTPSNLMSIVVPVSVPIHFVFVDILYLIIKMKFFVVSVIVLMMMEMGMIRGRMENKCIIKEN